MNKLFIWYFTQRNTTAKEIKFQISKWHCIIYFVSQCITGLHTKKTYTHTGTSLTLKGTLGVFWDPGGMKLLLPQANAYSKPADIFNVLHQNLVHALAGRSTCMSVRFFVNLWHRLSCTEYATLMIRKLCPPRDNLKFNISCEDNKSEANNWRQSGIWVKCVVWDCSFSDVSLISCLRSCNIICPVKWDFPNSGEIHVSISTWQTSRSYETLLVWK